MNSDFHPSRDARYGVAGGRGPVLAAALAAALAACSFSPQPGGAGGDGGTPAVDGGPTGDGDGPDSDGDGVADDADNCPDVGNAGQYDEDGDEVGDACDNCPGMANADQSDALELEAGGEADGVGDACDPRPEGGGDSIVYFDGFNGTELDPRWQTAQGGGDWRVEGGVLYQTDTSQSNARLLYFSGASLERAAIDTAMVYDEIPPPQAGGRYRFGGVIGQYGLSGAFGTGYSCEQIQDYQDDQNRLEVLLFDRDTIYFLLPREEMAEEMAEGVAYSHRFVADGQRGVMTCGISSPALSTRYTTTKNHNAYRSGFFGVRAFSVAASFRFVVIYRLAGSS